MRWLLPVPGSVCKKRMRYCYMIYLHQKYFCFFLMMYYINGDRCDEYLWWPHQSCFHFHGRYQFLSILKWICAIGMRVYIILHRQCMRSFVENSYGELWHAHWLVVIQCIVRYRKFIDVICDVIQTEMPYHSLSFSIQHCVAEVFNLLLKCTIFHDWNTRFFMLKDIKSFMVFRFIGII